MRFRFFRGLGLGTLPVVFVTLGIHAGAALPPPPSGVQTVTAHGMEFAIIGSPGNAPTTVGQIGNDPHPTGRVDYTYAISRTEVTNSQWYEFVQAYAPYYTGSPFDSAFTGTSIGWQPGQGYIYSPTLANVPADPAWHFAARYVNWLHNNKSLGRSAFETGVYDASTFGTGPFDPITEVPGRLPGARFALPSQDEWVKAGYFDPHRYGTGLPGYWLFPNSTDLALVPGNPGVPGAMTSAGGGIAMAYDIPVASYPQTQSPWGLFDASGGRAEWTDTLFNPGFDRARLLLGSQAGLDLGFVYDKLDWNASSAPGTLPFFAIGGFRVVSVPLPHAATGLLGVWWAVSLRHRNTGNEA